MLAACVRRNSRQLGPDRRGAGSSRARASRRRMLVGDTQRPSLPSSPQIRRWPPTRILAREPQHQLPNLSRKRRPSAPSGRLPPLPTHKRPMPTKQRPWSHQQHTQRRPGQVTSDGRQQRSISCAKLRPRDLAAENLELVTQHQQLEVFHMQAAAATNQRTEQGPKSEIEEGEDHVANPPSPRLTER
jgi:hypothetical protein